MSEQTRQTRSYLQRRFQEAGLRPDPRHGQNFLIDLNLLDLLVETAQLSAGDVVLEVGTGLGSLTARLAARVAAVVTVELDKRLFQLAAEQLQGLANVTMLNLDVLRNKNNLRPQVLEAVARRLGEDSQRPFKLVANLPYSVATPLISNLLLADPSPVSMTVTIQKELADRIAAQPATKDYGALSIWVQSQCRVSVARLLPPTVFWPRPKVDSAIIQIVPDPQLRQRLADAVFFHRFVRGLFQHRRKFLRSGVHSACKPELDKADVDAVLQQLQLGPDCRAEQLPIETLLALTEAVRARIGTDRSAVASLGGIAPR